MAEEKPRRYVDQTVRQTLLLVFLWLMGGYSTGLVVGLIMSGGARVGGLFAFPGIILGLCGGLVTAVNVYNLKTQKRFLSIKSAAHLGVLATIPLDAMVIWMTLTGEKLDEAALGSAVLIILLLLVVGIFLSLCVRLVANWGLRQSIGVQQA